MSQKYIPNETMLICMTGTKMSRLQVTTQSTSKMSDGRLIGTYLDKMEDNLNCTMLNTIGAAVGAICVGVLAVALGVTGIGLAALVVGGAFAGSLINRIPCICAMISASMWVLPHPTVRICSIPALPEKALLPCMLGGPVKILLIDLMRALQCAVISAHVYGNGAISDKELEELGIEVVKDEDLKEKLKPDTDGKPMDDDDTDFHAKVYKIKEMDGTDTYVLAFRGTQTGKDWINNAEQGVGMDSEQYNQTAIVAQEFGDAYENDNIIITGHSKGGGQATLAGAILDKETYAYNPAGVHDNTLSKNGTTRERADTATHSFHAQDRDILNTVQDNKSVLSWVKGLGFLLKITKGLPSASGDRIGMETNASLIDLITTEGHGMSHLIDALKKELKMQKPITVITQNI